MRRFWHPKFCAMVASAEQSVLTHDTIRTPPHLPAKPEAAARFPAPAPLLSELLRQETCKGEIRSEGPAGLLGATPRQFWNLAMLIRVGANGKRDQEPCQPLTAGPHFDDHFTVKQQWAYI